jgi:hypothetical protein
MDRITKALLEEYCKDHGLASLSEDKQFEYFATYLVMNRLQIDAVDPADIVIGEGGDNALDAIGIVANGSLILEPDQIEDLAKQNSYLDVAFIFVQAERSSSFASAKIGEIGFGVEEFFKEHPTLPRNAAVTEAAEIMRTIYNKSALFRRGNPVCRVFYVTTGTWVQDQHLEARRVSVESVLNDLGLFREVDFTPVGALAIQKLYRESQNSISREFVFAERTVVPEITGVSEAYLGFLPAKDYLRLITDVLPRVLRAGDLAGTGEPRDGPCAHAAGVEVAAAVRDGAEGVTPTESPLLQPDYVCGE